MIDLEETNTQHVQNSRNNGKGSVSVSKYEYMDMNLSKSLDSHTPHVLENNNTVRMETRRGGDGKGMETASNMRNVINVRNEEIHQNENVNKNSHESPFFPQSPLLLHVMLWISNSVTIMFFSLFITLTVTRKIKWFYILLSVFLIATFVEIIKIITMRYNAEFLYRPGKCISEHTTTDTLFFKNFILEEIFKRIDTTKFEGMGFPSGHLTTSASILTLIYLFCPKYKKFMLFLSPIYLALMGYSRIYLHCHTLLQVIAGIITGIVGGNLMYKLFK